MFRIMDKLPLNLFSSSAVWSSLAIAFCSVFMLTSCAKKELSELTEEVAHWDCPLPADSRNLPSRRDLDSPEKFKERTLYELRQAAKGKPLFFESAREHVDHNKKKYDIACERLNKDTVAVFSEKHTF